MSDFEALTLVLSCIAVIVSLIVWSGQRKLQREANDLQKVTAELSRKQLQLIKEQEQRKFVAQLGLSLVKDGKGYKLVLANKGEADALAVDLRPVGSTIEHNFLIASELKDKLPIKRLRGGEEVRFLAAIGLGTPFVSEFHVSWQNADGSTGMEDFSVSL
jgi:hypothetical protein